LLGTNSRANVIKLYIISIKSKYLKNFYNENSQSNFTLKYFSSINQNIIIFIIISYTLANDDKIGTVTEINGTIVAINDELEERDLLIHDPFFLNEEIFVTEGSSATYSI
jgi:hypothetical protein